MLFYRRQGWQGWIGVVFWIAVVAAVTDPVRTLWGLHKRVAEQRGNKEAMASQTAGMLVLRAR
jgi:hypothetical protein